GTVWSSAPSFLQRLLRSSALLLDGLSVGKRRGGVLDEPGARFRTVLDDKSAPELLADRNGDEANAIAVDLENDLRAVAIGDGRIRHDDLRRLLHLIGVERLREEAHARGHLGTDALRLVDHFHFDETGRLRAVHARSDLDDAPAIPFVRVGVEDE